MTESHSDMSSSLTFTPGTGAIPAGLPHVAYIVLWYPLFTQPFIFREIENLRKVIPLQTYTLYGENFRKCSTEMLQTAQTPVRYGAKSFFAIMASLGVAGLKKPGLLMKLFKKNVLRSWNSLEIFGENLWGFCVGVHLAKRLKEDGIDLIYAPWPRGAATAARVASALSGLPFAISVRGDNLDPADPDLADKLEEALFVRANNKADRERIRQFDHAQAQGKTILVYNSLTLPEAGEVKSANSTGVLRILALGRFDVTKGFDVLLKACAILKERQMPFHLTLAGGGGKLMGLGNEEKKLRRMRKDLHLEKEVDMPGLISHNDLPDLMKKYDVFAAPCIVHESGRRDGIPNTVIEAMAFGLPIVATDVNALPEVIKNMETGLGVSQNDPAALANALAWVSLHPEQARELGHNAALLARKMFDPEQNAIKLANEVIETCGKDGACAG